MAQSTCPNCDFEMTLNNPVKGEILECPNCFQAVEVISVSPLELDVSTKKPEIQGGGTYFPDENISADGNLIELNNQGLKYNVHPPLLARLLQGVVSRKGFAPLEHISLIQLVRFRIFPGWFPYAGALICLFSLFVTSTSEDSTGWVIAGLILGILMILLWLFAIETVITVDAEGRTFLYIWFTDHTWAEELIESYENLTTKHL